MFAGHSQASFRTASDSYARSAPMFCFRCCPQAQTLGTIAGYDSGPFLPELEERGIEYRDRLREKKRCATQKRCGYSTAGSLRRSSSALLAFQINAATAEVDAAVGCVAGDNDVGVQAIDYEPALFFGLHHAGVAKHA